MNLSVSKENSSQDGDPEEPMAHHSCDALLHVLEDDEEDNNNNTSLERNKNNTEDEIVVYRSRWLMLVLYSLSSATSAILWISSAPVASLVQTYYGINAARVNALSIVFMAAYLPMTVVSSYFFQKWGVRAGMTLACGLNCASGLIRFLSTINNTNNNDNAGSTSYEILLAGQILGALAQPFFTNMPARIGSLWFPISERDLAVILGSLSNLIGIAAGSIIPAFYIVGDVKGDNQGTIRMFDMLLMEFLLTIVVFLLVAVVFREGPPTPPSLSESNRSSSHTVWQQLGILATNRDFGILTFIFGVVGLGIFNCLTTILEQLIEPAGYSTDDASLFAGLLIGCGIISAIAVGVILDWTHKYNEFL